MEILTGTAVSHLVSGARIWTLTVPRMPRNGEMITWSEPACGSVPANDRMRGWITGEESYTATPVAGTVILQVTGGGTRWTVISIETPQEETPREFYANQKVTYTAPNGDKHSAIILEWRESMHHYTITLCDTRRVVSAHETHLTARQS